MTKAQTRTKEETTNRDEVMHSGHISYDQGTNRGLGERRFGVLLGTLTQDSPSSHPQPHAPPLLSLLLFLSSLLLKHRRHPHRPMRPAASPVALSQSRWSRPTSLASPTTSTRDAPLSARKSSSPQTSAPATPECINNAR